jgi:hypothetical protein
MERMSRSLFTTVLTAASLLSACTSFDTRAQALDGGTSDARVSDGGVIVFPPHDAAVPMDGATHDAHDASPPPTKDASMPAPDAAARDTGPASSCDGSTCGIETIAANFQQLGAIAVDGTNVYFEDQGTTTGVVYQCAKTGCATATVLGPGYATGIGVDANNVYWNDFAGGVVVRCAIGGCANSPTVIAPTQTHAEGVSFDGSNLYWAATGNIVTCVPPSCTSATTLATGQSTTVTTVASESGSAYWISSGSLFACGAAGCASAPTTVTTDVAGSSLAVKNGFAYFASNNAVISCPVTSACAFPHTVGSSNLPFGLGTDGVDVYWLDDLIAYVYRCPVTGCIGSAEVFADQTSVDPSGETGANVVLDGEYAYWVDATNVYRKHK